MEEARKTVAQNRKAHFNYIVTDSIECGIALEGSEVKSIKAGNISFDDSFAFIENGEVWLQNFHISEYSFSSVFNHEPDRKKKLLLHKDEIKRLQRKTEEKGFTLVPLEVYLKKGLVKINLGLCKGKKEFSNEVDLIVDDGDKKGSLPSTIVLLKNGGWKVLRQGSVIV